MVVSLDIHDCASDLIKTIDRDHLRLTKTALSKDPVGLGGRQRRRWILNLGGGWGASGAHRIGAMHDDGAPERRRRN